MLVKIEYINESDETKRHFDSKRQAYEYFGNICKLHKVVSIYISERLLYARCESKQLKGLENVLRDGC